MRLDDAIMKVLEQGPGNPRQVTERLVDYVRKALNALADDNRIGRAGYPGQGNEKIYSIRPPIQGELKRRV